MADGRRRHDWAQSAGLMALIANVNRDRKRRPRPFTPADFSPFSEGKRPLRGVPLTTGNIDQLARVLGVRPRKD